LDPKEARFKIHNHKIDFDLYSQRKTVLPEIKLNDIIHQIIKINTVIKSTETQPHLHKITTKVFN